MSAGLDGWQWQWVAVAVGGSGSGSGWVAVAGWQWEKNGGIWMSIEGDSAKKMEGFG
jgi:hypothetical protein